MVLLEYQLENPHLLLFSGSLRTRGLSFWKSLIGSVLQRPENNYAIKREHILLWWIFCLLCWPFGLWKVLEWAASFFYFKSKQFYKLHTDFLTDRLGWVPKRSTRWKMDIWNNWKNRLTRLEHVQHHPSLPHPPHLALPFPWKCSFCGALAWQNRTNAFIFENYPLQIIFSGTHWVTLCIRVSLRQPHPAFVCPHPP